MALAAMTEVKGRGAKVASTISPFPCFDRHHLAKLVVVAIATVVAVVEWSTSN